MPAASISRASHTVMRGPRMQGWPERWPGAVVMRERFALLDGRHDPASAWPRCFPAAEYGLGEVKEKGRKNPGSYPRTNRNPITPSLKSGPPRNRYAARSHLATLSNEPPRTDGSAVRSHPFPAISNRPSGVWPLGNKPTGDGCPTLPALFAPDRTCLHVSSSVGAIKTPLPL